MGQDKAALDGLGQRLRIDGRPYPKRAASEGTGSEDCLKAIQPQDRHRLADLGGRRA
jgi:hypothetical protein